MNKPQETIADFKHRIALIMRNREGGKRYSLIGAAPPPEWCRKKVEKGETTTAIHWRNRRLAREAVR